MVTFGRIEAVIVSLGADTARLIVVDAVWVGLLLSLTEAVKVELPVVDATPEIVPVDERLRPAGRLPDVTDHV